MAGAPSRRHWWVTAHRWIGLSAGIVVAFLGLTGATLAFFYETEQALNPAMFVGSASAELPPDALVAAALAAHPDLGAPSQIVYIRGVSQYPPTITLRGAEGLVDVTVDGRTGAVLGRRDQSSNLMWWLYDLHASLGLARANAEGAGHVATGASAILMLALLTTGVVLWWPRNRRFRVALTLKWGASGHRRIIDLHRLTGIYCFLLLLPTVVTGLYLAQPGWIPLQTLFGPAAKLRAPPAAVDPRCDMRLTPSAALAIAQAALPGAIQARIGIPQRQGQVYAIGFFDPASARQIFGGSDFLYVDPTCGTVLEIRRSSGSTSDLLLDWILPVHNGSALGLPGRITVVVLGLIPTGLLVTGFLIYRRKRRRRQVV